MTGFSREQRIDRANELKPKYPAAENILSFYTMIAGFQARVFERMANSSSIEIRDLIKDLPVLFQLVQEDGSQTLRDFLENSANVNWLAMLTDYWNSPDKADTGPADFFLRTLLQPYAETLAARTNLRLEGSATRCPVCNSKPQLGVLRPEGEGAKLALMCLLCGTEWPHIRAACPNCEELDSTKLPVYQAEEFSGARLNMCDNCQTYVKCIDLSKDGHAVPAVDDLATLSLSMWAQGQGYRPIRTNLFGF